MKHGGDMHRDTLIVVYMFACVQGVKNRNTTRTQQDHHDWVMLCRAGWHGWCGSASVGDDRPLVPVRLDVGRLGTDLVAGPLRCLVVPARQVVDEAGRRERCLGTGEGEDRDQDVRGVAGADTGLLALVLLHVGVGQVGLPSVDDEGDAGRVRGALATEVELDLAAVTPGHVVARLLRALANPRRNVREEVVAGDEPLAGHALPGEVEALDRRDRDLLERLGIGHLGADGGGGERGQDVGGEKTGHGCSGVKVLAP